MLFVSLHSLHLCCLIAIPPPVPLPSSCPSSSRLLLVFAPLIASSLCHSSPRYRAPHCLPLCFACTVTLTPFSLGPVLALSDEWVSFLHSFSFESAHCKEWSRLASELSIIDHMTPSPCLQARLVNNPPIVTCHASAPSPYDSFARPCVRPAHFPLATPDRRFHPSQSSHSTRRTPKRSP
jgi:hypothetical protein